MQRKSRKNKFCPSNNIRIKILKIIAKTVIHNNNNNRSGRSSNGNRNKSRDRRGNRYNGRGRNNSRNYNNGTRGNAQNNYDNRNNNNGRYNNVRYAENFVAPQLRRKSELNFELNKNNFSFNPNCSDFVLINCSVSDKKLIFLLDTGAEISIIKEQCLKPDVDVDDSCIINIEVSLTAP